MKEKTYNKFMIFASVMFLICSGIVLISAGSELVNTLMESQDE